MEINGFGKEYNKNNLIFEGEYLNGKRFKGKEYYDKGRLRYEGDYLNGFKYNGIEYHINGNIRYKGDYMFEQRHGKGTEYYYYNSDIRFEGE